MTSQIFRVSGNKINTLLLAGDALRFSSQLVYSPDEFEQAWNKKLSLATKLQVKYESIRRVTKEDQEEKILIRYRTRVGIPSECEFSFLNHKDYRTFFAFMEKELYFTRISETMAPWKAVSRYLIGLAFTIAMTVFSYFEAIAVNNGTADSSGDAKARMFDYIIGLLGGKGVLAIGGAITCYIGYKIWIRWKNPPHRIRFVRQ